MTFTRYKNSYKDSVDEFNDIVHGPIITFTENATSVKLMKDNPTTKFLYELDSYTKYSFAVNIKDNFMYSKKHFGWMKYNFQAL